MRIDILGSLIMQLLIILRASLLCLIVRHVRRTPELCGGGTPSARVICYANIYAYISLLPFGVGIVSPNSFAVSIHN